MLTIWHLPLWLCLHYSLWVGSKPTGVRLPLPALIIGRPLFLAQWGHSLCPLIPGANYVLGSSNQDGDQSWYLARVLSSSHALVPQNVCFRSRSPLRFLLEKTRPFKNQSRQQSSLCQQVLSPHTIKFVFNVSLDLLAAQRKVIIRTQSQTRGGNLLIGEIWGKVIRE